MPHLPLLGAKGTADLEFSGGNHRIGLSPFDGVIDTLGVNPLETFWDR